MEGIIEQEYSMQKILFNKTSYISFALLFFQTLS